MEKEKKDIERKYVIIKEAYEQTKVLSEQTKEKLKNLHQEKETSEEVIKALRSMTKTKIDSVPDKELQIKRLQTNLEKEKKTSRKNARRKLFKTSRNKYNTINTINQKLITTQQNYENKLKYVTELHDDVKRINKEKMENRKD